MKPTTEAHADALEDPRLGAVVREYLAALETGQRPDRHAFLARHPDLADALMECLDALEFVRAAAPQLQASSLPGAASDSDLDPRLAEPLGDFRLVRELGRGGMGVVYEAVQLSLGRRVALKVLPFAATVDARQLQRFKNEAHAAAHLHHQHIVPVHGVGCERGVHYYAMQYIEGQTLAALIAGLRQEAGLDLAAPAAPAATTLLPPAAGVVTERSHRNPSFFRTIAKLGVQTAEALEHAHQVGVIHRDIKPANLLVDGRGHVWITDFGLARLQGDAGLTMTGNLVGTLRYMSPEQALARHGEVDHRTDVYALGATLYEALTLQPAFPGHDRQELLRQVIADEPRPLRHWNPALPAELETIVLKAMAKALDERYATAEELADDLRRFLDDRPIRARRPTALQRLRKWLRRHRTVVTAVVVSTFLALAVSTVLLALSERRTREALGVADARRQEAEQANQAAEETLADLYTNFGLAADERNDPARAVLWFANAARQSQGDPEREWANRVRCRTWGRQCATPACAIKSNGTPRLISFHPSGKYVLLLYARGGGHILDIAQQEWLPFLQNNSVGTAAWSPDGAWLAFGWLSGDVEIIRFPTGERLHHLTHSGPVRALAFSPDGRYLALASNRAQVWDCRKHTFVTGELVHPAPVVHLVFNHRGDRLATACRDEQVRVFAVPAPADEPGPLFAPVPDLGPYVARGEAVAPVFVDQDRGLLTHVEGGAAWWDAGTGEEIRRLPCKSSSLNRIVPSPDDLHFVLCGGGGAHLWKVTDPDAPAAFLEHRGGVNAASFSQDGRLVLTASADRTARLWTVHKGRPAGPPVPHQNPVVDAAFVPVGRQLATVQWDALLRVWQLPRENGFPRTLANLGGRTSARLSPDGRHVIASGHPENQTALLRRTRVFEVATGVPAGPLLEVGGRLLNAALSPGGRRAVLLVAEDAAPGKAELGTAQFWDWQTGRRLGESLSLRSLPADAAFDANGSRLAVVCQGGHVVLMDPADRRVLFWSDPGGARVNQVLGVRFAPDGRQFVTWGLAHEAVLRDAADGRPCHPPLRQQGECFDANFSPDGRYLATGSRDGALRVWDPETGQPLTSPLPHPAPVRAVCFHPSGRQLVTAGEDGMARVWDWQAGRLACAPLRHSEPVTDASFSPDGRWVLTVSSDGTARFWEWHTGKPVTPGLALGGIGRGALFTPDGRYAVCPAHALAIPVFDLADLRDPDDLGLNDLVTWAELVSGLRVQGGDVEGLTSEQWLERWRTFRARHPQFGLLRNGERAAWQPPTAADWDDGIGD